MDASLVRMANQVARNFAHLSGEPAALAVANHLRAFWTPAMRDDLLAHAEQHRDDLDPIVLAALDDLRMPVA